jgi:hypothetical protein
VAKKHEGQLDDEPQGSSCSTPRIPFSTEGERIRLTKLTQKGG